MYGYGTIPMEIQYDKIHKLHHHTVIARSPAILAYLFALSAQLFAREGEKRKVSKSMFADIIVDYI